MLLQTSRYDTTEDLPHQQRDRLIECRQPGCHTMTTRAHAVCVVHVDTISAWGCCSHCATLDQLRVSS